MPIPAGPTLPHRAAHHHLTAAGVHKHAAGSNGRCSSMSVNRVADWLKPQTWVVNPSLAHWPKTTQAAPAQLARALHGFSQVGQACLHQPFQPD